MIEDKLPRKLSELLKLALDDLDDVKDDPNYKIDMNSWHYKPSSSEPCAVCLAGSVMVKRCNADININYDPKDLVREYKITNNDCQALYALNYLRQGKLHLAYIELDIPTREVFDKIYPIQLNFINGTVDFSSKPGIWRAQMEYIYKSLKEVDL